MNSILKQHISTSAYQVNVLHKKAEDVQNKLILVWRKA